MLKVKISAAADPSESVEVSIDADAWHVDDRGLLHCGPQATFAAGMWVYVRDATRIGGQLETPRFEKLERM